jgi:hypothetical protein
MPTVIAGSSHVEVDAEPQAASPRGHRAPATIQPRWRGYLLSSMRSPRQGRHVFCPIALKMMALILGCGQSKM